MAGRAEEADRLFGEVAADLASARAPARLAERVALAVGGADASAATPSGPRWRGAALVALLVVGAAAMVWALLAALPLLGSGAQALLNFSAEGFVWVSTGGRRGPRRMGHTPAGRPRDRRGGFDARGDGRPRPRRARGGGGALRAAPPAQDRPGTEVEGGEAVVIPFRRRREPRPRVVSLGWLMTAAGVVAVAAPPATAASPAQPPIERAAALAEEVRARFEVTALSDGVRLFPRSPVDGVGVVELSDGVVAVDGRTGLRAGVARAPRRGCRRPAAADVPGRGRTGGTPRRP